MCILKYLAFGGDKNHQIWGSQVYNFSTMTLEFLQVIYFLVNSLIHIARNPSLFFIVISRI